jgi:hypothetical protein
MNTKIDDEPLTIKAALRLSPKIFEDIKSNFKREGIKHIYDLGNNYHMKSRREFRIRTCQSC